jgi:hypothetical protein
MGQVMRLSDRAMPERVKRGALNFWTSIAPDGKGQINLDTDLGVNKVSSCTATLIAPDLIITAGHCTSTDTGGITGTPGPGGDPVDVVINPES